MTRVISYARTATRKQAEDHSSIPKQLAAIRRYAAEQDWQIVGEYTDESIGGHTDRRPGFQRMIEDALSGQADLILVEDFSRLFRDWALMKTYRRKLDQKGIGVVSITQPETDSTLVFEKGCCLLCGGSLEAVQATD
jgi:DNA invertase Pin-like site-specific DNA recombinase